MFLTRTSCRKTTPANSYYGAWPGWGVSVSVLPLTAPHTVLLLSSQLSHTCLLQCWDDFTTAGVRLEDRMLLFTSSVESSQREC